MADWIEQYLAPHVTFECSRYFGESDLYANAVGDGGGHKWINDELEHGCMYREILTYPEPISLIDACALLQVDPVEMVIIHNILMEVSRDVDFKGKVCSFEGILF